MRFAGILMTAQFLAAHLCSSNGLGETHLLNPAFVGVIGGREVAPEVAPSVVKVLTEGGKEQCTGLLLGQCVMTVKHCAPTDEDLAGIGIPLDGQNVAKVERAVRHEARDVAILKLKGGSSKTATSRVVLGSTTPKPGTRAAFAGFGAQVFSDTTSPNKRSKVVGHGILLGEDSSDDQSVLSGGGLPSVTSSGDSGAPIVALDKDSNPYVIGIVEGHDKEFNTKDLAQTLIAGTSRMRWGAIAPIRKWIDDSLDKLGCNDSNASTHLDGKKAFAKMFDANGHGIGNIKLSNEEVAQLLAIARKDIPVGKGKITKATGVNLVQWVTRKLGLDSARPTIYMWQPETWGNSALYLKFSRSSVVDHPLDTVLIEGDSVSIYVPPAKKKR